VSLKDEIIGVVIIPEKVFASRELVKGAHIKKQLTVERKYC